MCHYIYCHDKTEILLKVALNTITLTPIIFTHQYFANCFFFISAGKTYVPSKVGISPKNGLYEVRKYDSVIDPFAKQTTQSISDPADPFKQKTGYSPTHKTTDIANRKIEQYEGYTYDTYYDYAFPNDKDRVKKKQEPKPKQEPVHPKPKPKVKPKSKAVEPPVSL